MGMNWAHHTLDIDAPAEVCFDAIVDYETFPEWQSAVEETDVLDRNGDGLGKRVKLVVDAKVRKVDYILSYGYQRPHRITWDFVEGNGVKDIDGEYVFEELGPNRTRATYKLGVEPGLPIPGPVARRVHKQTLKRSVEDLKAEAEKRAAAGGGAKKERGPFTRKKPIESTEEQPAVAPGRQSWPFDSLPGVVGEVARLPGRILVGIGRRLGG